MRKHTVLATRLVPNQLTQLPGLATVVATKSDSDVVFCLQLIIKILKYVHFT